MAATQQIIKRIGNDIDIEIYVNNGADLTTLLGYTPECTISITKQYGRTYIVPESDMNIDTASGEFSFTWKAGQQYGVGDYILTLSLRNPDTEEGNTIDQTQAIRLTKHTCQGTTTEDTLIINFEI